MVRDHRPDLVVSDVNMPEMDGFAMLHALHADPSIQATRVVLLTLLQEREHVRSGMTSGADDHLTKPIVFDELRESAAAQLNKQLMRQSAQSKATDTAIAAALNNQKNQLGCLYKKKTPFRASRHMADGRVGGGGLQICQRSRAVCGRNQFCRLN